jgi:glycosyltransferase involved in cell wall biosynthesis
VNPPPTAHARAAPLVTEATSTTRPLRVCIVAPSLAILGGQAIIAERLLGRLGEDRALELSFVPHNPVRPGALRHLQRVKYLRTIVTSIAYVGLLVRHLRRQDVVHVFSASYWSFILAPSPAVLIARAYGKRVILNYHSGEALDHLTNWPRTSMPILRRADRIVVPSGYLVDVFARFGLHAVAIANFVDVDLIPYRARRRLRPAFLANRNFAPLYNVSCVLRAFELIQRAVPDARLVVAGDGAQRNELHGLATTLGLRNVEFVGQVSPERMGELYDAADVYLNAPNVDNMPSSIIECFAAGLPVVTTNAGGIPYMVTHGETGLIAERDDHETLAKHALRLLEDDALVERMTARGREQVLERYTWAEVHRAWRAIYGVPVTAAIRSSNNSA